MSAKRCITKQVRHGGWPVFDSWEYDKDHTLLNEADKHPIEVPSEYDAYFVYIQEMMDKVDEIAGKYALDLAGEMVGVLDYETDIFFDSLGIQQLHRQDADAAIRYNSSYFYACGNFNMEFDIAPTGLPYEVLGAYRYNGKAYFDTVYSSVSSIENCDEWVHNISDGQEVLIVMDEQYAYVFCDRKDAFISLFLNRVNWCADGTQAHLTKQEVAQIADCFDFSVTPQKPDMELANQKLQASFEAHQKEQEAIMATYENPVQYDSYDSMIRSLLDDGVDAQSYRYALRDITGDGEDELFIGKDDSFGTIVTMKDGKIAIIWSDANNSRSYLCEGNIVKYSGMDGEYEHYNFMKLDPSTEKLTQFLSAGYDPWQESWYYSESFTDFTYISKAEFDEMVAFYQVIDIGMKPISEYPFS